MSVELLSPRARAVRSSAIRDLLHLTERPEIHSLAGGLPAAELLPVGRVAEATVAVLDALGPAALQYGPSEGAWALRELVAPSLGHHPDQVLITTGSQQALDLIARVLVAPDDVVVTEAPTYLGALNAMQWSQPRFEAIPGDRDGLRTDVLALRLADGLRPKLVYVVSNFANPTGVTLAEPRRRELAALADHYGFVIVDDDPYGALRFRGDAPPPLRTLSDRVVTLGSASKTLAPGLRVGWLAGPEWLMRPLVVAKQAADLHTATLPQHLVRHLLADRRWFDRHVADLVGEYGRRADTLAIALRPLSWRYDVGDVDGGMFLWLRPTGEAAAIPAAELLAVAVARGVAFVPGGAFHPDGHDDGGLRLCFTTLPPDRLTEAAARLVSCVAERRPPARA